MKDVYGVILRCLNDARREGWDRSRLALRCGIDVMQYLEQSYADLARRDPSMTWTEAKVWGCPFVADTRLSRNQLIVVSPDGDLVGGAYVAPSATDEVGPAQDSNP